MEKRFLSVAEVRGILGVSRNTVYALIKSGRLRAFKLDERKRNSHWFIEAESLNELLKSGNTKS